MRVVLAGGGSAGHTSPMLATADALRCSDEVEEITCVGTRIGLEVLVVPQAGYDLELVNPVPLSRRPSVDLLTLPPRILTAVGQAKRILRRRRADVVVGFGGYASVPVVLAARQLRVPVVIHEANAVPGLANRIAARFAAAVCVTFPSAGLPGQIVTGMPVRPQIATLDRHARRAAARRSFGLVNDAATLLVSGGSQGAKRLNDALMGALPRLDAAGVSVLHVTGKANFEAPEEMWSMTLGEYVRLAYVEKMEDAYAAADVMLARSGAATVTETAIVGLPTIFVPLPHGNGEQAKNAADVLAAHAGVKINDADLTSARLADEAIALLSNKEKLEAMSAAARALMPRDAAQIVAEKTLNVARTLRRR